LFGEGERKGRNIYLVFLAGSTLRAGHGEGIWWGREGTNFHSSAYPGSIRDRGGEGGENQGEGVLIAG